MVKEATKSLKTLTEFIQKGAEGKIPNIPDEAAQEFEIAAIKLLEEASVDTVLAKTAKVAEMNILDLNIHFFDNIPKVWGVYQNATELSLKQ